MILTLILIISLINLIFTLAISGLLVKIFQQLVGVSEESELSQSSRTNYDGTTPLPIKNYDGINDVNTSI